MASYAFFDTAYYIEQNPDVAASWPGSVQDHYTLYGAAEGRAPTAWFDAQYYRATYPDLAALSGSALFAHYCANGFKEGRVPSEEFAGFNAARYLAEYPDLAAGGITVNTALNHYMVYGEDEGRNAFTTSGNQIGGAVSLAVDSPAVAEGDSGLSPMVFTLTLSSAQNSDFTVSYETLNTGTATAGQDFVPKTGTVTFAAGQTTATVSIAIMGDSVYEPNETVKVKFASDAFSAPVTATGTIVNDDLNPDLQPQTLLLTTGQDILSGREGNDTFLATGATLQLGDMLDGKGGNDVLDVSISGSGVSLAGFAATSIETIRVKSLATDASTLDLSDTSGVTKLESYETSGASLTFRDVQDVNAVDVSIIDTDETHTYQYDANAYSAGVDKVDLSLSEVRGAEINFQNNNGSRSFVEQVDIVSNDRLDAGPTPAVDNLVSELNVGAALATVNITGNGDLEVEAALDENISVVNAGTLNANLTLDLSESNDGDAEEADGVAEIVYTGALGDDTVTFGDTNNAKRVVLQSGNDSVITGTGAASVDGGTGNDTIMTGALNDLVIGGEGNDVVTDAGADNALISSNAPYVSDGNSFNMGSGNDSLTVTGSGNNSADLGIGNDSMLVGASDNDGIVNGNQSVVAGAGNDGVQLYANGSANVDLGAGDDSLIIERNATANSTVTAGEGDDSVTINSSGNVNGTGDGGDDTFTINGNGGHTIDMGDGDDILAINGDGTHNLTLGNGNDTLTIDGSRNTAGNADNGATDGYTVINAGDGNDTVSISEEHFLKADLGAGDDHLSLRAKDLSADDIVAGGAGNDTLTLTNETQRVQDGRVLASETSRTTGFETYDLRDSNITLTVTDEMIETAEGMDFTVSTLNSNQTPLPSLTWVNDGTVSPFSQGMTYQEYSNYSYWFSNGSFEESYEFDYSLDAYLAYYNITVDFADANGDGDTNDTYYPDGNDDLVYFQTEVGTQTVDITSITTPDYAFTLTGGSVQDIVIADDDSINGRMTLDFNGSSAIALSFEDTLRVVGEAEITAADLRNVSGLERIELSAGNSSQAVTWGVELTDRVINQTTGSATLVISVDANTPAGSVLYITLDPSIDAANNNVVIEKNANVTVYINDVLVTEPMLGYDFNTDSPYTIKVVNQLNFTANADNLIGGEDDDTFHAASLAVIQAGDSADGQGQSQGGVDTLDLQFAVNDASSTLDTILGANLQNIERIEFNTENNVEFGGIGLNYAPGLDELATGDGDDTLTLMRQGLSYELNAGDDSISLLALGAGNTTEVDGGAGYDELYGSTGNDRLEIASVEYVDGNAGEDTVTMQTPDAVQFWNVETINGSFSADNITADGNGIDIVVNSNWGDDTVTVGSKSSVANATVNASDEADTIWVRATNNVFVNGDQGNVWDGDESIYADANNVTVNGFGGNDTITVDTGLTATIDSGAGNDRVTLNDQDQASTVNLGSGSDVFDYNGGSDDDLLTVTGGDGDDTISVDTWYHPGNVLSVSGGNGADSIDAIYLWDATINGDGGNDTINATHGSDNVGVNGGDGNDVIVATHEDSDAAFTVDGGTGVDNIRIGAEHNSQGTTTVSGGYDNDQIELWVATAGGKDTVVFGNVTYDGLQNENFNSQGTDAITGFNWEPTGPTAGAEDVLNLSAFNGGTTAVVISLDGTAAMAGGGSVDVVSTTNDAYILTNDNWATSDYTMANNQRGVLIIGKDTDAQDGFDLFDVYYVQDVDAGAGVAVKVNLVGTIDSATNIGLATIDTANFL